MIHRTSSDFWEHYNTLPPDIQKKANGCFALLKNNPRHPSLCFKKASGYWSVRVGKPHRALAFAMPDGSFLWFWIGLHDEYERILADR